jgi:predicted RNase H-like HicB family nuclease
MERLFGTELWDGRSPASTTPAPARHGRPRSKDVERTLSTATSHKAARPVRRSPSRLQRRGQRQCDHEGVSETLSLTVHFEDAGDGWVLATIPEVPGAISQGRTREEARENVIDALRTVLTPDHELAGQAPSSDDESLTLTIA